MRPLVKNILLKKGKGEMLGVALYGVCLSAGSPKPCGISLDQAKNIVSDALNHLNDIQCELAIVLFPELAITVENKAVADTYLSAWKIQSGIRADVLLVFGIKIEHPTKGETYNQAAWLYIATKSKGNQGWQQKLTYADEERAGSSSKPTHHGEIGLLNYRSLKIAILTCSDFFKPIDGTEWSATKILLSKRDQKQVSYLILNPQQTRTPDDGLVLNQMDALFSGVRQPNCVAVMQANALYEGVVRSKVGGRIISNISSNFPRGVSIKGLSPKIKGIEFPWEPSIFFLQAAINTITHKLTGIAQAFARLPSDGENLSWVTNSNTVAIEPLPIIRLSTPERPMQYAEAMQKMGDLTAAQQILQAQLDGGQIGWDEKTGILHKLGYLLQQQGDYDQAYEHFAAVEKKWDQRIKENHPTKNISDDFLWLNAEKSRASFRMYQTRYLQNGHVADYLSNLKPLIMVSERIKLTDETRQQRVAIGNLHFRRHILVAQALHDKDLVAIQDFEELADGYLENKCWKEAYYVKIGGANWLRSKELYRESKAIASEAFRFADNIGDSRLAELAARCIGEVNWAEFCLDPSAENEAALHHQWKSWRKLIILPHSLFGECYLGFSKVRFNIHRYIEDPGAINNLISTINHLDDVINRQYQNRVDNQFKKLCELMEKSIACWEKSNITNQDFKDICDPFIAWAKKQEFWWFRFFAEQLCALGDNFDPAKWKQIMRMPDFQLWA